MKGFAYESKNSNTFLTYRMQQDDELDTFTLGMVSNNRISGLLPLFFTQMNQERLFLYNVTSRVSLRQYMSGRITKQQCVRVFRGITNAILSAEEYMLNTSVLLTDPDYIFMNVSTGEASVVCLPLCDRAELVDFPEYFRGLLAGMIFSDCEHMDYPAKILNALNASSGFTLESFKDCLDDIDPIAERKDAASPATQIEDDITPESFREIDVAAAAVSYPAAREQQEKMRGISESASQNNDRKNGIIDFFRKLAKSMEFDSREFDSKEFDSMDEDAMDEDAAGDQAETKQEVRLAIPGRELFQSSGVSGKDQLQKDKDKDKGRNKGKDNGRDKGKDKTAAARPREVLFFGETTFLDEEDNAAGETVLLKENLAAELHAAKAYLFRIRNNERIPIDGSVFKIGKEKSYVNYFVADNPTVSRSHADILFRSGRYYLIDNNSTNHTYLEGKVLRSGEEGLLEDGAKILLGNEEFLFQQG